MRTESRLNGLLILAGGGPLGCGARYVAVRVADAANRAEVRQRRGWTQVELAERLGLDRSYLADVERGHRNVSLVNLELIAMGFDLTLPRLFSRL